MKVNHRFAVFSDIHANLPALKAVLNDIDRMEINESFCLGDLVDFAPWPNEVIDLLRLRAIPVLIGNHDYRVAYDRAISPVSWHSPEETRARVIGINISKQTISTENLAWLRQLPQRIQLELAAGEQKRNILLVHASPNSLSEYVNYDHPQAALRQYLVENNADIMITGHTHRSYIRQLTDGDQQCFVANAGAVGRIKPGQPQASWLLCQVINGEFSMAIKRVAYDVAAVAQAIKQSAVPDFYAEELLTNGYPSVAGL
jgi:predicted phosphodiesterase